MNSRRFIACHAPCRCPSLGDFDAWVQAVERRLWVAGSTDRCNTFCKLLSWGLIEQGLSGSFIELPCGCAELGLAMQGQDWYQAEYAQERAARNNILSSRSDVQRLDDPRAWIDTTVLWGILMKATVTEQKIQQQEALQLLFGRPEAAPIMGEYQREQRAILTNLQQLKAERLAREAAVAA